MQLAEALKGIGFTVDILVDATREDIISKVDDLPRVINKAGGILFFHYGGHGVQVNGKSYIIPIDVDIPDERKVVTRAIDIDDLMLSFDGSGSNTNIVILDACRNNPLPAGATRTAMRGLSVIGIKPKNSIIIYSAEAGTVAQDGLFTPALTEQIKTPGKSFTEVLVNIRQEVYAKSSGTQIPGEYNQLFEVLYLNGQSHKEAVVGIVNKNQQEQKNQKPDNEMIQNGHFVDEEVNWYFWADPSITGVETSFSNNCFELKGKKRGRNIWDIDIKSNKLYIEKGQAYIVKFDAMSTKDKELIKVAVYENGIDVNNDGSNYTAWFKKEMLIIKEMKNYTLEFTMSKNYDDPYAALIFYLGNTKGDIKLKNVSFKKK